MYETTLITYRLIRPPIKHPKHPCATAIQQYVEQQTVVVFRRRTGSKCLVGAVVVLSVASLLLAAEPFYCAVDFCFFENQFALNSACGSYTHFMNEHDEMIVAELAEPVRDWRGNPRRARLAP